MWKRKRYGTAYLFDPNQRRLYLWGMADKLTMSEISDWWATRGTENPIQWRNNLCNLILLPRSLFGGINRLWTVKFAIKLIFVTKSLSGAPADQAVFPFARLSNRIMQIRSGMVW